MMDILGDGPSMRALLPKFEESYKMKKDGHKVGQLLGGTYLY